MVLTSTWRKHLRLKSDGRPLLILNISASRQRLYVDASFPSELRSLSLLITTHALPFLHLHIISQKKRIIKKESENEERETIPRCSLVLYVSPGPGGALSHLSLRRKVLPQLPLLGFPAPSLSLKIFFSFAASAFFSPSPSKCYIASLPLFTL